MRSALAVLATLLVATMASAGEGVLEINQVCAVETGCFEGDTAGYPVTIESAGSYRLTGNLEIAGSNVAIEINSPQVSIDLGAFRIRNPNSGNLFAIHSTQSTIRVSNGAIRGLIQLQGDYSEIDRLQIDSDQNPTIVKLGSHCRMTNSSVVSINDAVRTGSHCLVSANSCRIPASFSASDLACLATGTHSVIKDNRISSNASGPAGIRSGPGSLIAGNTIQGGFVGIASSDAIVIDNVITAAGLSHGIVCAQCVVRGNRVRDRLGFALFSSSSSYINNIFDENNGGNANPQVSGGIDLGGNVCGGDTTCP